MGLDMFLIREVIPWSYSKEIKQRLNEVTPDINWENVTSLNEEIGYWRKANHIHNWFVENVQEKVDDCERHYVAKGHLIELLQLCRAVMKEDKEFAENELSTTTGFFFGGSDYDESYYYDTYKTIQILKKAIKFSEEDTIYYISSW